MNYIYINIFALGSELRTQFINTIFYRSKQWLVL